MTKIVVLLVVFLGVKSTSENQDKYTTRWDNIDIDNILKSDRLLRNYINCLLEKGRCTPDGLELKKNIPDVLQNGCVKCSEFQRANARKIVNYISTEKRPWFLELERKYDPDHMYRKKYAADIKNEDILIDVE